MRLPPIHPAILAHGRKKKSGRVRMACLPLASRQGDKKSGRLDIAETSLTQDTSDSPASSAHAKQTSVATSSPLARPLYFFWPPGRIMAVRRSHLHNRPGTDLRQLQGSLFPQWNATALLLVHLSMSTRLRVSLGKEPKLCNMCLCA
jgi:hypothetical protein